ncbi:MAG: ankyrin repeat domain-containing protein [Rickettsiales bacterium]|nr:ankyrin repeat domain-containing protein [Rickettsiales bacterium]
MQRLKSKLKSQVRKIKHKAFSVSLKTQKNTTKRSSSLTLQNYVIKGNHNMVTKCLNNNHLTINNRDENFKTALDYAIQYRWEEIINDLILVGARVSMSFYECKSDFELLEILKILDKCNYNYNNIDCLGFAPIHYASGQAFEKSVKFLLNKKVDINIRSIHGETALKYALRQNRSGLITGDC